MKAQLLKVSMEPAQSFSVRQDLEPSINNKWHYHQEIELIYFNKGDGTQFIGDSIKRFKSGDIVLLGANLPHYWRFDDAYFTTDVEPAPADVRVVHFSEQLFGDCFINLPENKQLKDILEKAKRGVKVTGKNRELVAELITRMLKAEGTERIIILMQALVEIAKSSQLEVLSSVGFHHDLEMIEKIGSMIFMITPTLISKIKYTWKRLQKWRGLVRTLSAVILNRALVKPIRNS